MSTLHIDHIKIARERFREDNGDIKALAASISMYGQLQPIIVEDDGSLVAGFRRYSAIKLLGRDTVEVVYKNQITETMAREIELEENLQRKNMNWLETQKAITELDRLKRLTDPNWGQAQTAAIAGVRGQADVSEAKKLVRMAELFPQIKKAKTKKQALSWSASLASNVMRVHEVSQSPEDFSDIESRIWLGDSVELIKDVPDESFRLILTDPPFGIGLDDRKTGSEGEYTSYEDGDESYGKLLSMGPDLYRTLKPDGFLIWFFGPSWFGECKTAFRDAGFIVDEMPIIWDRSDGRVFTTRPDRYFGRGYDMALHCIKGDPQIVQRGKSNVLRIPPVANDDREALVERPVELYAELINRLTVRGESVADFFVGSGSCPAAAASLHRNYFGCERDALRRAIAIKKVKAWTPAK